jgi:putative colanic acid biosynthesis acetyltransferase WcaF
MPHLYLKSSVQSGRYASPWPIKDVIRIRLWHLVWLLLYRPTPKLFNRWRLFLLWVFGAKINGHPFVYSSARVFAPFLLTLEHHACLGPFSEVYNLGPVRVEAYATVSQQAYLCNGTHDLEDPNLPLLIGNMTIKQEVFIGARAFIMPGVSVGEGAVVGACAVVTKDVEPWTMVAGNPARVIKKRVIRETGDGETGDGRRGTGRRETV